VCVHIGLTLDNCVCVCLYDGVNGCASLSRDTREQPVKESPADTLQRIQRICVPYLNNFLPFDMLHVEWCVCVCVCVELFLCTLTQLAW